MQTVHWKSGHKQRCLPSSISQDASEPSNNRTLREVQEGKGNRSVVLKSYLTDMILENGKKVVYLEYHCMKSSWILILKTVASKRLWREYEIAITDECEDKVCDDNGQVNSWISSSRVDESIEALIDSFEVCKAILVVDGYIYYNFQLNVIVSTTGGR